MADELSDDDKKLAKIFAHGLGIFDAERKEAEAKEKASGDGDKKDDGSGSDGDKIPKSWRERLLG